jgi:hypothetical protein
MSRYRKEIFTPTKTILRTTSLVKIVRNAFDDANATIIKPKPSDAEVLVRHSCVQTSRPKTVISSHLCLIHAKL